MRARQADSASGAWMVVKRRAEVTVREIIQNQERMRTPILHTGGSIEDGAILGMAIEHVQCFRVTLCQLKDTNVIQQGL